MVVEPQAQVVMAQTANLVVELAVAGAVAEDLELVVVQ